MIRVFLASDDPEFSQSLCEYLVVQSDIQICGKAAISVGAAREANGLFADVAILEMPIVDDLEVVDCFKKLSPNLPLLLLALKPRSKLYRTGRMRSFRRKTTPRPSS
jgi:DNA-binding NarL/FixJ family response regulator